MVYPIDASTRVNLVFFDGDTQLTQESQRQRKRINETHRLITRTISVVRLSTPTQYHCFPRLNNTIFLMPSQALDTSTSSQLSLCVSEGDVFSTFTTRCADQQVYVPDGTNTTWIAAASSIMIATTYTAVVDVASSITSECLSTPSAINSITTSNIPLLYSVILPIVSLLLVIAVQSIAILGLYCRYRYKRSHKSLKAANESTHQFNPSSINSIPMTNARYSTQSYLIPGEESGYNKVSTSPAQYENVIAVTIPHRSSGQDYDEIVRTSPPSTSIPLGYTHLMKEQLDSPHPYM